MAKNFKFILENITFTLPIKFLKTTDWNGKLLETKLIDMTPVAAGKVVKQYVKNKYPHIICSTSSSFFANGNSLGVYLSNELGESVDDSIYNDVSRFGSQFEYGGFNGMIDMYEYWDDGTLSTDTGIEIEAGVKYMCTENKPKFISLPDVVRMLKEMTTTDDGGEPHYVFGVVSVDDAVERITDYGASKTNLKKALEIHINRVELV